MSMSLFWKSAFRSHIPYPTRPLVTTLLLPSTYLFISFKKKNGGGCCKHFFSLSESAQSQTRLEMRERRERLFFFLFLFSFFFPSILLPLFFSQCFSHSLVWVQVMFRMFLNLFCFEFKEG